MKINWKSEGVQKGWETYRFAILTALAGMILLLWPEGTARAEQPEGPWQSAICSTEETERNMEEILGRMNGVGQVKLMLTVESLGERELAQSEELSYRGRVDAPEDYERSSQPVLLDGDSGEETVVTRTGAPIYRGALVVCTGGDRPEVKLEVTRAVASLTGLSADRITVAGCP